MLPPSTPKSASQADQKPVFWDSSDPNRAPNPLPPNPYTSPGASRPLRGGSRNTLAHQRMISMTQSAANNKDSQLPPPPPPRDLFGSTSKYTDSQSKAIPPLRFSKPEGNPPPPAPRHTSSLPSISRGATPQSVGKLITDAPAGIYATSFEAPDDEMHKLTTHDLAGLSAQLSSLTTIANNLQREMNNLSRRSKDNATDLISLKEGTKNRDEEIRTYLRELVRSLPILDSLRGDLRPSQDRSASPAPAPPSHQLVTTGNRSFSYGSSSDAGSKGPNSQQKSGIELQLLERILKDMSTKEAQDRVTTLLREVQDSIRSQPRPKSINKEDEILSLLHEIKDKDDSKGKELVLPASERGAFPPPPPPHAHRAHHAGPVDEEVKEKLMTLLEDIRDEMKVRDDDRIIKLLEEIKEKQEDDKVMSMLDDVKLKDEDERIDKVLSVLDEIRAKDVDEKVLTMLEELKATVESMAEGISKQLGHEPESYYSPSDASGSKAVTQGPSEIRSAEEILNAINNAKEGIDSGNKLSENIKHILEDWRKNWQGHDKEVDTALKGLAEKIGVLATEQRNAVFRMSSSTGLPSQALATRDPPLPPDLDNEAAITALANIASTTTRTDITLSSINALIKVFQKDAIHANTSNAENFISLGRYLDKINETANTTGVDASEARKVLEVVRIGVSSGNDRIVEFETQSLRKIEELLTLQRDLNISMLGDEGQGNGIKSTIEKLRTDLEDLMQKNLEATIESNPADLIYDLKKDLGEMAERSLETFKRNNSSEAIAQLKAQVAESAEKSLEAIKDANAVEALEDFRLELKEMLEKSLSLSEIIASKADSGELNELLEETKQDIKELMEKSASTEVGEIKSTIEELRKDMEDILDKSLTSVVDLANASAEERMIAAFDDLKKEIGEMMSKVIGERSSNTENFLEPIEELRKQVTELMEKSTIALAVPVKYPEAEEIKGRIEALSREVEQAMEKTAIIVSSISKQSSQASEGADEKIRLSVDDLKSEILEMKMAMSNNSTSTVEDSIRDAFEDMRKEVMEKIEKSQEAHNQSAASASDKIKEAVDYLKKEVGRGMGTAKSGDLADGSVNETLEELRSRISELVEKSLAVHSGQNDVKDAVEELRKEVLEKSIAMSPESSEETTTALLQQVKKDIAEMLEKFPLKSGTGADLEQSLETLRKQISEITEKSAVLITPKDSALPSKSATPVPGSVEEIISDLRADIGEMVERSLAAAIANSTFDSEEKVKEAIDDLKKDVKDTLEMSMMPLPPPKEDSTALVRVAFEGLRQELEAMFTKKSAVDDEAVVAMKDSLNGLKGLLVDFVEKQPDQELKDGIEEVRVLTEDLMDKFGEVKVVDAVEELKVRMDEVLEKLSGRGSMEVPGNMNVDVGAVMEGLKKEMETLIMKSSTEGIVKEVKKELENLIKSGEVNGELKNSIETLTAKISVLSDSSDTSEVVEALTSQIQTFSENSSSEMKETVDGLKKYIEGMVSKTTSALGSLGSNDTAQIKEMITALQKDLAGKTVVTTGHSISSDGIHELRKEIRRLMERPSAFPTEMERSRDSEKLEKVKELFEEMRKEIAGMAENTTGSPPVGAATLEEVKDIADEVRDIACDIKDDVKDLGKGKIDLKEAVSEVYAAMGECRVEVAVVKSVIEEKSAELKEEVSGVVMAVAERTEEIGTRVAGVKETLEGFQAESKSAIEKVEMVVMELQNDTNAGLSEVKEVVEGSKSEMKEAFGEFHRGFEGVHTEVKEAVTNINEKMETAQIDIKDNILEVKIAQEDSRDEIKENFAVVNSTLETFQAQANENFSGITKALGESHAADLEEHQKTQRQVEDVLDLVDGFQSEWKGEQPNLFNALSELKRLLQEAQEAAARRPEPEPLPPPPAYDDSQTQEKLDLLISGNTRNGKYLSQLDLLDSIQKQVAATSADISQFIAMQTNIHREDVTNKIAAARQAELELERANSERKILEAATSALREEHANLQDSIEQLKEETDSLHSRKMRLKGDVVGLETALSLRQEELLLLEARAEGLERRVVEGVIEQSRALLSKPRSGKLSKAETNAAMRKINGTPIKPRTPNPAPAGRRHLSLNQINNESHLSGNKSGRTSLAGTTLGLGMNNYSAGLGLLKRSQSVKSNNGNDNEKPWGKKMRVFTAAGGKENERNRGAELDDVDEDESVDDIDTYIRKAHEGDEDESGFGGSRRSSDSVVKLDMEDVEDESELSEREESGRRKLKTYPALGLEFSARKGRDVSETSSRV
ncbi:hypothetical protein RUND412_003577 [Rhizina undulata]